MNKQQLEYRISQYLDGTLPAQDVADLLRRIGEDAEARELLEMHRRMHEAIKAGAAATQLPSLDWNKVARKLSASITPATAREAVGDTVHQNAEASEELERSIIAYIDGTLDERDRPMIEARLSSDAAARKLADEYRNLNSVLDHGLALPEVRWEQLSSRISAEIDAQQGDQALSDEREFELTQYLDGDLAPEQVASIESQLASDGAARRTLREHAHLAQMLKAMPLPAVNYDLLADHISDSIEGSQRQRLQISFWMRKAVPVAVAACILIASGIAIRLFNKKPAENIAKTDTPVVREIVLVTNTTPPEPTPASGVIEIDVGASDSYAARSFEPYSPGVVSRPQRVQLAETVRFVMEPGYLLE